MGAEDWTVAGLGSIVDRSLSMVVANRTNVCLASYRHSLVEVRGALEMRWLRRDARSTPRQTVI